MFCAASLAFLLYCLRGALKVFASHLWWIPFFLDALVWGLGNKQISTEACTVVACAWCCTMTDPRWARFSFPSPSCFEQVPWWPFPLAWPSWGPMMSLHPTLVGPCQLPTPFDCIERRLYTRVCRASSKQKQHASHLLPAYLCYIPCASLVGRGSSSLRHLLSTGPLILLQPQPTKYQLFATY